MSSTIDTAVVPSGTWTFDATHSSVGFTVVYMGVAPFSGAFRTFEASLDETGLRGTAQVSSIDVDYGAAGRAPRIAGLLRGGDVPRALLRGRNDHARRQ